MSKENDQIAELLTDDSFLRWINGEASNSERKKWNHWLRRDPDNCYVVRQAKELTRSLQFEEEYPDTVLELTRLKDRLDSRKTYKHTTRSGDKTPRYWLYAAAVIVLLITVLAVVQYTSWMPKTPEKEGAVKTFNTAKTDYGETKKLKFSDGSQITLNAHSKLRYPTTHKSGDMEVTLEGEAYFNIVHKTGWQQRTFTVCTPQGKVAVLGTRFNVNTNTQKTEVVLEEGKVQVQSIDTSTTPRTTYTMHPGERALLVSNKGNIEVQAVDTELYTSWRNFELKFKNTPLSEIADRLKAIYGVNIEFSNKKLKEVELSGSAPNKNFKVLLGGLRTLLDIPILHKDNTIIFGSNDEYETTNNK